MAHRGEASSSPRSVERFGLTEDELFRLWKAAIKDDDKIVDEIIQKIYDEMIKFNRERAEVVMSLAVRRHREAESALQSLFTDMREIDGPDLLRPGAEKGHLDS